MLSSSPLRSPKRQAGLAILAVLIVLVTSAMTVLVAFHSLKLQKQREREVELLQIGQEFLRALTAYVQSTPGGGQDFPRTLDDLLEDKRQPTVKRYLRRIAIDPMTHEARWGLVRGANERITGIYSLSDGKPFKRANFPQEFSAFSSARNYRQWRFVLTDIAPPPGTTPANPGTNAPSPAAGSPNPILSPSSVD
jgi:hypothetical protein